MTHDDDAPRIRPAEPGDIPRLIELQRETVSASYRPFLGSDAVEGFLASGFVEEYAAGTVGRCTVIEAAGQVVGCAIVDGDLLDLMMVEQARHRRGLGSLLLEAVEQALFAEHSQLRLESFAPNEQANAFYRKHGWHARRRFPDAQSGVDKIEFVKRRG